MVQKRTSRHLCQGSGTRLPFARLNPKPGDSPFWPGRYPIYSFVTIVLPRFLEKVMGKVGIAEAQLRRRESNESMYLHTYVRTYVQLTSLFLFQNYRSVRAHVYRF